MKICILRICECLHASKRASTLLCVLRGRDNYRIWKEFQLRGVHLECMTVNKPSTETGVKCSREFLRWPMILVPTPMKWFAKAAPATIMNRLRAQFQLKSARP